MRLFWLEKAYQPDEKIQTSKQIADRFSKVLRLSIGYEFHGRDPDGYFYHLKLTGITKNSAEILVMQRQLLPTKYPCITVLQSVPKGNRFEEAVTLLVEAGVSRIIPVITDHSEIKPSIIKQQRWQRLAIEAIEQSGNLAFRGIEPSQNLLESIEHISLNKKNNYTKKIFCHQEKLASFSWKEWENQVSNNEEILLAVGPEGGFSNREINFFQQMNFSSLYFYDTILRSEHAAFFFVAALKMFWQKD